MSHLVPRSLSMRGLAALYPPLSERQPFPPLYQPLTFLPSLIPFFFRSRRRTAICVFPILLGLCIRAPCYTFGDPSMDYYNNSMFVAMPIWFVEFAMLTPKKGLDAPRYVGNVTQRRKEKRAEHGWENLKTSWQRLAWAFSLMIPSHRGIGWQWQVKNVPDDPNRHLPKWVYVRTHTRKMLLAYVRSAAMLVALGYSSTWEKRLSSNSYGTLMFVNAVIGWSSATWVWARLNCFYSFLAAASVALGLCETWHWPALMGSLKDAWSVRQMWSVVYHQTMRKPALRITRFVGLQKSGLGSRYSQLYLSFAVSCLLHQFQMFNVTRRDMGEFVFFMSQPIAITLEDFVRWIWVQSRSTDNVQPKDQTHFRGLAGYLWVFLWFSLSLPLYVKACRDAEVIQDAFFGTRPFDAGARLASSVLDMDGSKYSTF